MASREWTVWHLTPDGWKSGSQRRDHTNTQHKEPPENRVLSVKYYEFIAGIGKPGHVGTREEWRSTDEKAVHRLKKEYGDCPESL